MDRSRRDFLGSLVGLPLLALPGIARARPVHTIRVNIPGPGALPFTPLELIPKLGFDRVLKAKLHIRHFPSGVQGLEDMLAGNADFAGLGFSVLPTMRAKGQDVVAIAPLSGSTPPLAVVVDATLRDKVRTLADLRGRSIGVPIGSAKSKTHTQRMAELMLASGGVQRNQVRWVGTGQNIDGQTGALLGKMVDAVFCEEPFPTMLVNRGAGFVLADLRDPQRRASIPGAAHLRAVLATRGALVREDPQQVKPMVEMLQRTLVWMHVQKAAAIVARLDVGDEQERRDRVMAMMRAPDMFPSDTRFSRAQVEATRAFLKAGNDVGTEFSDPAQSVDDTWAGSRP
ncbi:MAG: ABC transporter substrate-binding protein [Thiobacillus sp.]